MTRWEWSYLVWGAGWIAVYFGVAELGGYLNLAPWATFSQTCWHAQRTYPLVARVVFGIVLGLAFHLVLTFRMPLWHALGLGLGIAFLGHLADKHWP